MTEAQFADLREQLPRVTTRYELAALYRRLWASGALAKGGPAPARVTQVSFFDPPSVVVFCGTEVRRLACPLSGTHDAVILGNTTWLVILLRPCIDGEEWLHVALHHADRIPTYEEVYEARRVFFSPDAEAIEVFPPASEHVNTLEHMRHLWSCPGRRLTPRGMRELV